MFDAFHCAYRQILSRMRHRHPAFAERMFKLNVAALSSDLEPAVSNEHSQNLGARHLCV
jgi:hypothetical protein